MNDFNPSTPNGFPQEEEGSPNVPQENRDARRPQENWDSEETDFSSRQQQEPSETGDPSVPRWDQSTNPNPRPEESGPSSGLGQNQPPFQGSPWQNAQQGYRSGGYNAGGYNPSGYRNPYGASSQAPENRSGNGGRGSWQDPSILNSGEPYKWNFEEYDNAKNRKTPGDRNSGRSVGRNAGKIILALLGTAACLGLICLAGVGAWYMLGGSIAETADLSVSSSAASKPDVPEANPSAPGLTLTDRPTSSASSAVAGEPMSTPDIADKVKPSVVGILNYGSGSNIQSVMTPSEGSGIIMSEDGYILTNAHVVENAAGLKVVMETGEEFEARIVGADDTTDIAVIKINAEGLQFAEFGNSDQLRVGEKVVAIGNPRGLTLAGSVTQGIVSAVNRSLSSAPTDFTYIQTDAAINPGNSGGALVNEYGQVIGINTSKISQVSSTVYEGIGFAIPITEAKPIIDDLKAYGRVTGRVKFGVIVQPIDAYTAAMYQVPQGAMVVSTEEGSDIAAKGIVAGDIIYAVDGNTISSTLALKQAIVGKKPGDSVTLSIYRRTTGYSDKKFDVTVILMEDNGESTIPNQSDSKIG